jgi:hypothetical protein
MLVSYRSIIVNVSDTTSFLVRSTQFRFSRVAHVSCGGAETIGKASFGPVGRAQPFSSHQHSISQSLPYAARLVFDVTRHIV